MTGSRAGISWKLQCTVFLLAAALVISRRPDLIFHAHFYGEDGNTWYGDAYNLGWLRALTMTACGYLNTLQRLVGSLALLLPIRYAPLLMNTVALVVQVLPACFLLSSRCEHWWPLHIRIFQAALYLVLPNTREIHIILTNAPFHLALLAFLVAIAAPPRHWGWKVFDVIVLAISALSGPFCILIFPIVMVFWWVRRQHWSIVVIGVLFPLIALQGVELLRGGYAGRAPANLGATPMLFARLLSGHVFVGSLWGENGFVLNAHPAAVIVVFLFGISVLLFTLRYASLELRLFIILAFCLFGASLSKPLISGDLPQWQLLAIDRSARYWFFPMLAVSWSLLFCVTQKQNRFARIGAGVAFLALAHGLVHDHRYPPFPDQHFRAFVREFNAAPPGSLVRVPDGPPGLPLT